jgi:hypothetical protein
MARSNPFWTFPAAAVKLTIGRRPHLTIGVCFSIDPATITAIRAFMSDARALAAAFKLDQPQLDRIEATLAKIIRKEETIMVDLTALTTQVQANTDAEAGAVVLLENISALLRANANDPAAINDLATKLETSRASLAAAVVANTPAA